MSVSLSLRAAVTLIASLVVLPAYGQILPRRQTGGAANPPGVGAPAAPAPGETAGQTRREGRQEARESRAEVREAGAPGVAARDAARDTRQATRQNIQATRAADFGVWFNAGGRGGLVIDDLSNNGLFATAGFRSGDQIVSINGQAVTSETQFVQYLTGPNLGTQPVQVVVLRNGQQQTLVLQPAGLTQGIVNYDPFYQYGLVIDDSRPNQYVVQRVYPRTPAYYAGIRVGDVVTTYGGQRITSLDTFSQSLARADGQIALGVTRNGQARNIQLDAIGNEQASARTTLRPNFDAEAGATARLNDRNNNDRAQGEARTDNTLRDGAPAGDQRREAPATRPSTIPGSTPAAAPPAAAPTVPNSAPTNNLDNPVPQARRAQPDLPAPGNAPTPANVPVPANVPAPTVAPNPAAAPNIPAPRS